MTEKNEADKSAEATEEREKLLAQIAVLDSKIRQKINILMAHPKVPEFFKEHPVVKEVTK